MSDVEISVTNKGAYAEFQELEAGARRWAEATGHPVAPSAGPVAMLFYRFIFLIAPFFGATTVTIDESYASTKQGNSERRFGWTDFNGWFETENYIGLMITKTGAPLSIPKSPMSHSELSSLHVLIGRKLGPQTASTPLH